MILKNSEYDAVMRRYDEIRERHLHLQDERTDEVLRVIPEFADLEREASEASLLAAKARISDPAADLASYRAEIRRIADRRAALLRGHGYPEDYLELTFDCPVCRDTGFVDGRHCSCFDRIAAELVCARFSPANIPDSVDFDHFSFDIYSDTITDETTGMSPRDFARVACNAAKKLVGSIGGTGLNLYIYGNTGVGKTFLSHCIAKEAARLGHSVLYFSSGDLFELLADSAFSRNGREGADRDLITGCDLLIIDDLGTERVNAFVGSELFRVVNSRIAAGRSTVISSNLSLGELSSCYSERVFSRISSMYDIVRLIGSDIRISRKLNGGQQ